MNCCVVPNWIDGLLGVIAIDTSGAALTVSVVEALMPLNVAVMSTVPGAIAAARPLVPAVLLMVATVLIRRRPDGRRSQEPGAAVTVGAPRDVLERTGPGD